MRLSQDDRGIAAVWVTVTFLFLTAAAAIAVDTSGAFGTARTDQTTADLACLAGVVELPDTSEAITQTVNYSVANWPEMAGHSPTIIGTTATYSDGAGNTVAIDAQYNGDPAKMHVTITEQSESFFGKTLGASAITVTQEAFCRWESNGGGLGLLPVGVLPGGFAGNLFGPAPCDSGNCGGLDFGSGSASFEDALATGVPRSLGKHHGNAGSPDPDHGEVATHCNLVGDGERCHMAKTKTGQMAGPLGGGIFERFKDISGSSQTFTYNATHLDGDTPAQVLDPADPSAPTNLWTATGGTQPTWWETSIHGPWTAAYTAGHFYYDGVVAKCDSPRYGQVPIVVDDEDWNVGDPSTGWPNGTKTMKIIWFLDVIITDPNDAGDFQGSGAAKSFGADIIHFGPNAVCSDGSPVGVNNGVIGTGDNRVFLVDSTN